MTILNYIFIFILGSTIGWLVEIIYNLLFFKKKFINPGFLSGPYLPIYGFGFIFIYLLSKPIQAIYIKAVVFFVSNTLLELLTGIIFVKFFRIRLWNYSDRKLNFKGHICIAFSTYWTLLSLFIYMFLYPFIDNILNRMSDSIIVYSLIGFYMGIFCSDVAITFDLAHRISKIIREKIKLKEISSGLRTINFKIFKKQVIRRINKSNNNGGFLKFIIPFGSRNNWDLRFHLDKYFNHIKDSLKKGSNNKDRKY